MGEVEAINLLLKGLQVAEAAGNVSVLIDEINQKRASGMSAADISKYLDDKLDRDFQKLKDDIYKANGPG